MASAATHAAPPPLDPEAAAKEKALQERQDKRATIAANVLRKFMTSFQTMVEQDRLAKIAAKNRPRGKKKKKKEPEPPSKSGKPKGPKRTAAQQAWFALFADLDERIFKNKRMTLEDLYRGVAALAPADKHILVSIVVSTAEKALRPTILTPNQISIKAALRAATHANDVERDRVVFTPAMGVSGMHNRGCSVERLLQTGFREGELLKAGLPTERVVAACDDLARLRAAGLAAEDVLDVPHVPRCYEHLSEAAQLRRAGYSAAEAIAAGIRGVVQLRDAGYSMDELKEVGAPVDALRAGAFGHPDLPPLQAWVQRSQPLFQDLSPSLVPRVLDGTRSTKWRDNRLLQGYTGLRPAQSRRPYTPPVPGASTAKSEGGTSSTHPALVRPRTGPGNLGGGGHSSAGYPASLTVGTEGGAELLPALSHARGLHGGSSAVAHSPRITATMVSSPTS